MRPCFPRRLNRARHQAQTSLTLNQDRLQVLRLIERTMASRLAWVGRRRWSTKEVRPTGVSRVQYRCAVTKGCGLLSQDSDIAVEPARAKSLSFAEGTLVARTVVTPRSESWQNVSVGINIVPMSRGQAPP
jgi:hypothetical protein